METPQPIFFLNFHFMNIRQKPFFLEYNFTPFMAKIAFGNIKPKYTFSVPNLEMPLSDTEIGFNKNKLHFIR